jgi:hypothetical protein
MRRARGWFCVSVEFSVSLKANSGVTFWSGVSSPGTKKGGPFSRPARESGVSVRR